MTYHPELDRHFLFYHKIYVTMTEELFRGFFITRLDGGKRTITPVLHSNYSKSLIISGINSCDYNYSVEVKNEIEKLFLNKSDEFEWGGGERTLFFSGASSTIIVDNFNWTETIEISTERLYTLFLSRLDLMNNWSKDSILDLIKNLFKKVVHSKQDFVEKEQDFLYSIKNEENDITIKFILMDEDFDITDEEFLNQIELKQEFFKVL